jgi:hypothetical protein
MCPVTMFEEHTFHVFKNEMLIKYLDPGDLRRNRGKCIKQSFFFISPALICLGLLGQIPMIGFACSLCEILLCQ